MLFVFRFLVRDVIAEGLSVADCGQPLLPGMYASFQVEIVNVVKLLDQILKLRATDSTFGFAFPLDVLAPFIQHRPIREYGQFVYRASTEALCPLQSDCRDRRHTLGSWLGFGKRVPVSKVGNETICRNRKPKEYGKQ
jgi:hypothetical protein